MSNILIINGHQKTDFSEGLLNKTLTEETKKFLSIRHLVKESVIENGYDTEQEQEKFKWAHDIIFQYPIYWFSAPSLLQQYIQDVYAYGIFYAFSSEGYGKGGLLKGRRFMLSTTWNSPREAFGHDFWEECAEPKDALIAMRKTQEFVGLKEIPMFSCHNVVKKPNVETYLTELKQHLDRYF